MALYNVHKSSMSMKLASNNVFMAINGTLALTQRLCMTFVSITACQHQPFWRLARWKRKKKEDDEQFCVGGDNTFRISGASQVCFDSLKGCYQRRYYCRECQISLKVWDSEKKWRFHRDRLWDAILHDYARFQVDPGIVVSFYASAHHPYTTLAIDEWMIHVFWLSEDSPVEVGSNECSRHLVFKSSLLVRLLLATLQ